MYLVRTVLKRSRRLFSFFVGLSACSVRAETLTILDTEIGTTPVSLGYNLGHFMPASNAADWFRYSGVNAARVFISVSDIEPADDISPVGDGVTSEAGFFARRTLLRDNAATSTQNLSNTYVNWAVFSGNYNDTAGGNNRIQFSSALANLRDRGISILANITASPSRFPITNDGDWAGKWELWQHFYAQAFLLSRDYGVRDFSMFNEPNGWIGMTETDWLRRYRICSDAIQSAVVDMNSRYGKSLVPRVFAPNTANGAEKYNTTGVDEATTDTWGADAVTNRHLRLDGTTSPGWMNLHVYNYQKYTTRQIAADGLSGFVTDFNELRELIDADMPGEPALPIALTEFNVRTGASYDLTPATQDSPLDFSALGANCIALSESGVAELYLFKFGQTANSAAFYGIAKNGTHYVENANTGNNNYGGTTQCAEVYRLFAKAAKGARPRHGINASAGASPASIPDLEHGHPRPGHQHLAGVSREQEHLGHPAGGGFLPTPGPRRKCCFRRGSQRQVQRRRRPHDLAERRQTRGSRHARGIRLVDHPAGADCGDFHADRGGGHPIRRRHFEKHRRRIPDKHECARGRNGQRAQGMPDQNSGP